MQPQWHDIILLFLPGLIAMINNPLGPERQSSLWHWQSACGRPNRTAAHCGCTLADFPGTMAKVSALVFGSYAALWKRFELSDRVETKNKRIRRSI